MEKAETLTHFAALQTKFPHHEFRHQINGIIQRKYSGKWRTICHHNRIRSKCKDCGGTSFCEHNRIKSKCKDCGGSQICEHDRQRSSCKDCGGGSICEHDRQRTQCKDCGGSQICEHDRRRSQCKECGGASICEHDRRRSQCKECGGASICEHNRHRSKCKDCGGASFCEHDRRRSRCTDCGGGEICEHERQRSKCKDCGGTGVCECGERLKQNNGLCNHCNPDFVFSGSGCSKIACKYFDALETILGVKIQHKHLENEQKCWIGDEHRPKEWQKKPVDGYYVDDQLVAIEFLGDYYHGHPRFWEDGQDKFDRSFKDLFADTETKLTKLKSLGYKVYYVWESDFNKNNNAVRICREFLNKLETF